MIALTSISQFKSFTASVQYLVKASFSFAVTATSLLFLLQGQVIAQEKPCKLAPTSEISSKDQAKCLLRPVRKFGNLDVTLLTLPTPFDKLLSLPTIDLDKEALRRYLKAKNIRESDIGGSLDNPVSRGNNNSSRADLARYFIIHDTSTPNFENDNFPANINDSKWSGNNLQRWTRGNPLAHVFVSRVGESVTPVNFSTPWRATSFEVDVCGVACKGLFLSIEMVQPRRSDPRGGRGNDAIAPNPGFTDAQLDRLALVYIAASVRRGKWMIPAFHASLDAGIDGAHDDPQNFSLEQWSERLNNLLQQIRTLD